MGSVGITNAYIHFAGIANPDEQRLGHCIYGHYGNFFPKKSLVVSEIFFNFADETNNKPKSSRL